MSDSSLLIAILAAGASRRLGQPKQLIPLAGEPLLRRQCRMALAADLGPVTAILGCEADRCRAAIADLPLSIRVNASWEEGLASSIREATRAALEANAAGLLLFHGDQHCVTAADLRSLHTAWCAAGYQSACRSHHAAYTGPPVILPARCFPDARTLAGDDGARPILAKLGPAAVRDIAMPNAAHDLDTPAQLAGLNWPNIVAPDPLH